MTERSRATLAIVLASVAISTSSPFARLARPAHPMVVACGRVFLAALLLGLADLPGIIRSARALSPRDRARVALAGLLLGAHFACFQWGLDTTSLPAAVSLVSLEPLAVVLTAWAFFGIRPLPLERVGVLIATAGALVVARGAGEGEHRLLGDLLVLAAVVLFGFYVASARALRDALPARHYAPLVYASAAVPLALALPFVDAPAGTGLTTLSLSSCCYIALIALIPTGLGHTLIQTAARTLSPSLVAMVSPGETLGSILIASAILGTVPSTEEALGGALVLVGAVVAVMAQRRE